jgi:hypothetical protein
MPNANLNCSAAINMHLVTVSPLVKDMVQKEQVAAIEKDMVALEEQVATIELHEKWQELKLHEKPAKGKCAHAGQFTKKLHDEKTADGKSVHAVQFPCR